MIKKAVTFVTAFIIYGHVQIIQQSEFLQQQRSS